MPCYLQWNQSTHEPRSATASAPRNLNPAHVLQEVKIETEYPETLILAL